MPPLARVNKLPRRLLRRPSKTRLWLRHQTLNCMWTMKRNLRSPNLPKGPPKARRNSLQRRCTSSTQTCCLQMLSTCGTRLSKSRQSLICSRAFKACPGKAQGDCCMSCSMTVSCSTFSPCFPTTRLRKKSTTIPTCSRSPNFFGIPQFVQCVEQLNV